MKVYINDKEYEADPNETIIQVADRNGIKIPRFCYHKHLSVVASCRMCLVEIEDVKFAQPACSTPIRDNMRVSTKSTKTQDAQKSTMEFLLINHPLDCPICDQAGECELQDVSLKHGDDHSKYLEFKRVVVDEDISPLISTEMTRCIHCSRCVRFGEEVAGKKELGLINRGEFTEIRAFIEDGVSSELSGNMIDLCPVGALNNKLYSYRARTWDLKQYPIVSPHDCIGSNIYYHVYNNEIVRAVPKENSQINQTWLSDRDRFGYQGIYSSDRCLQSKIRKERDLITVDKQDILEDLNATLSSNIKQNTPSSLGCFISPQSTSEEMYLFQNLLRGLGVSNIDHRTNERDFSYQNDYPLMPSLGTNIDNLNDYDNIILVGVNIKTEFPILTVRLNNTVKHDTKIYSYHFINMEEDFPVEKNFVMNNHDLLSLFQEHSLEACRNKKNLIIIGPNVTYFSNQSVFLEAIDIFSSNINAEVGYLTDFCNSTSGWILGNVPHRRLGGEQIDTPGLNVNEMLESDLSTLLFFNLDPENDFYNSSSLIESLRKSSCNIFFTSFITPIIEKYADYVIPISTFAEAEGSFINIEGKFQSFNQVVKPNREVFKGWDVLNRLSIMNNLKSHTINEIRNNLSETLSNIDFNKRNTSKKISQNNENKSQIYKNTLRHIYSTDQIVRRAKSLNNTTQANNKFIYVSKDVVDDSPNKKILEVKENDKLIKIDNFKIKDDLPSKSIVYSSSFNNKFTESKSTFVSVKK
tara:strand:- start:13120 stop:15372 length:2253 start_codon:yes stop_codon:yes gene_type:complete